MLARQHGKLERPGGARQEKRRSPERGEGEAHVPTVGTGENRKKEVARPRPKGGAAGEMRSRI